MAKSIRIVALLACVLAVAACAPEPGDAVPEAAAGPDAIEVPEGPLPDAVMPVSCKLALEILPDAESFSGRTEIAVELQATLDGFWMHGQDLEVAEAALVLPDGRRLPARYEQVHEDGIVRLSLPEAAGPGPAVLEFAYTGKLSDDYSGIFRVEQDGDAYVFSEFEPNMARRAFPGFDDPRFKIPYRVEMTTRDGLTALSNGPIKSVEKLGDGLQRVGFAETRPLPSYLVAFAIGPLDVVEGPPVPANEWRPEALPLQGVAPRGKGDRLEFALANTGFMVEALEAYFETAYPYEKLDLVALPGYPGAMENAGLIFYAEDLLLLDEYPSFRQLEAFGSTHAHELAHQWMGNLVTMTWWDDLWLNEASSDWMAGKIMALWRPDLHYDRTQLTWVFQAMDDDSLRASRRVREPVTDAAGMYAAFDSLTYAKGAAVLGMLEAYVGDETFREAWRAHMARYRFQAATVFDFIDSLEQAAGDDLEVGDVFLSFLVQPGVPMVTATVRCDSEAAVAVLDQQRYLALGSRAEATGRWRIPVCMRWDRDGVEGRGGRCALLAEEGMEFPLGPDCPRWVMPNRAAAGYYRWTVEPEDSMPLDGASRLLDDLEGMSLADSLAARVHAGTLGAGEYLAVVPDLAAALERSVSLAPVSEIQRMFDYLVAPQDLELARAYVGAIYQRRLDFLDKPGGGEAGPERERFRSGLVTVLAEVARDPSLRTGLAAQAAAYTGYGGDGRLHPEALPPDLVRTALKVGVQDLGEDFFDHLLVLLATETATGTRKDLLIAMGSADQPTLLARARNLLLDDRVRDGEVSMLLWQLTRPPRVEQTLAWLAGQKSAVIERIHSGWRWNLPLYFAALCDTGQDQHLRRLFGPYLDSIPGIATALDQATEQIAICEAYRSRHTVEVRKFFRALGGAAPPGDDAGFAAGPPGG